MGHRAKNKQPAPQPLDVKQPHSSSKKLGKRKAESLNDNSNSRPVKRPKDQSESKQKGKKKKKKVLVDSDAEGSADGWEDVADNVELKIHAKYVPQ